MSIGIDSSVLLSWYQSTTSATAVGITTAASSGTGTTSTTAATPLYAPTPPWDPSITKPAESKVVTAALNGATLINPSAAKLDLAGASSDYKNLFALYQGLNTLYDIADTAGGTGVSSYQLSQLTTAFNSGMTQVSQFIGQTNFSKLRLTEGTNATSETTTVSTPAQPTAYETPPLNTSGDVNTEVPAFEGDVQFDVAVQRGGALNTTVHMNLDDMGSTPRTMGNVVAYLNSQMAAAGAVTSFSSVRIPATPDVVNVGGTNVTVSQGQDAWSLQVNTNSLETVSLSAPQTNNAVYVGQVAGNQTSSIGTDGSTVAPDAQSQLQKIQTDGTPVTPPVSAANATTGRVFLDSLGNPVNSIQETATSPDGSVYVLANVNQSANGVAVAGGQDVALMKYDSAGKLLFSSDLGSVSSASGMSLAVSADGKSVAVAGSITGPLSAGQTLNNPTGTNSFVSVFDSQGNQTWNKETDGLSSNQANSVAFGADGSVYVVGQAQPGVGTNAAGAQAPSNGYLQVYSAAGKSLSKTAFGSGTVVKASSVAVDGTNVYVAGTQDGHAVVSEFDVSTPTAPSLVASRDLGDLQGGNVVGVAVQNGTVYLAGSTQNGALAGGTVTSAATGGIDTFAATLSTGLASAASDAIAYYGGAGDDVASAMTVSNGQVWITGSSTGDLPGEPAIGSHDGFAAAINVATGSVGWSQRFTGLDGKVAPTSIAVASTGASVLDQLGLPQGVVNAPVSNLITATTGVKAGDSFSIATNGGSPVKITIQSTDSMASLATEIGRATGFNVNVSTSTLNGATTLVIKPVTAHSTVTLVSGPSGADALSELGLKPGLLDQTVTKGGVTTPADGKAKIYGLGITGALSLSSTANITHAKNVLTAALSVIKSAYQDLKTAATPASVLAQQKAATASGKVPAYLTAQIANYQAALTRLTGSSS